MDILHLRVKWDSCGHNSYDYIIVPAAIERYRIDSFVLEGYGSGAEWFPATPVEREKKKFTYELDAKG